MVRHTQDSFLSELTRLFSTATTEQKGSIQITWKAYSPAADAAARAASSSSSSSSSSNKKASSSKKKPAAAASSSSSGSKPEVRPEDEPVCLIHARLHNTKLSTLVPSKDVARFHRSFQAIITVNCSEQLLAKGEKRKAPPASTTPATSTKPKEKKAKKSDKKKGDAAKTAGASDSVPMEDVAPAASSSSASATPAVPTRRQRYALAAANKKPKQTKQQRRDIRHQPNPRKDLEKKRSATTKPAAASSTVSATKPTGKAKGKTAK